MIGRIQIQAHKIAHFFHEERVVGELEIPAAVRLHGEELKDPVHGGLGKAVRLRGEPNGPVGSCGRLLLQSAAQQDGDLLVGNRARPARAKLIVDARQPMLDEALPPLAHGGFGPGQTGGDLLVGEALGGPQH